MHVSDLTLEHPESTATYLPTPSRRSSRARLLTPHAAEAAAAVEARKAAAASKADAAARRLGEAEAEGTQLRFRVAQLEAAAEERTRADAQVTWAQTFRICWFRSVVTHTR
jgi:hypothetical protein